MGIARPVIALDSRRFGRRAIGLPMPERPSLQLRDDMRLFLSTFAAGLVFVAVLIA